MDLSRNPRGTKLKVAQPVRRKPAKKSPASPSPTSARTRWQLPGNSWAGSAAFAFAGSRLSWLSPVSRDGSDWKSASPLAPWVARGVWHPQFPARIPETHKPPKPNGCGSKLNHQELNHRFWSMLPRARLPFWVPIFDPQPNQLLPNLWLGGNGVMSHLPSTRTRYSKPPTHTNPNHQEGSTLPSTTCLTS